LAKLSQKELKNQFELQRTPKLAPWITGKHNVPPEALTRGGITWDSVKPLDKLFFEEPRRATHLIFSPRMF
jgi:hypothetical protein